MIFTKIKCFFLLCIQRFTSSYRCDASQFGNLIRGKALNKDILEIINPGGLALCARECLYRTRCQSFNYADSSDTCQLVGTINTGNLETVTAGSYYSEKSTWPMRIAGLCSDHNCSTLQKCVQNITHYNCTDIFHTILQANDTEIKNGIFDVVSGISKDDCVKECLYRSQCESFNHRSNNDCELSTMVIVTDLNNFNGNSPGSFYSAISQYDGLVAGNCVSRPCLQNEVCQENPDDSYTCSRNYCPKPLNTTFDNVMALYDRDKEWYPLQINLTYKCQAGYYPVTEWSCQHNGTWTSPSCLPVTKCSDIFNDDKCSTPNKTDALFVLKHSTTETDVILYCKVNDHLNWIQFPNINGTYSYYSTNISDPACRQDSECGRTIYQRIRVVPGDQMTILNYQTHATKDCPTYYGSVIGNAGKNCTAVCNIDGDKGEFQIDLRGTGLKLIPQTSHFDYGSLKYKHDHQMVKAVCDDCNNKCTLQAKKIIAATNTYVNYTGAIRPVCKTQS